MAPELNMAMSIYFFTCNIINKSIFGIVIITIISVNNLASVNCYIPLNLYKRVLKSFPGPGYLRSEDEQSDYIAT